MLLVVGLAWGLVATSLHLSVALTVILGLAVGVGYVEMERSVR